MDKKKKSTGQSVSSRNRNKNRNRTLQTKAKERVLAKQERVRNLDEEAVVAEVEVKNSETPIRDDVVVVPERSSVDEAKMVELNDIEENDSDFVKVRFNKFRFVDTDQDGSPDKFKFVEYEEAYADNSQEELEEFNEYNAEEDDESDCFEKDDSVIESIRVEAVGENEEYVSAPTDNVDINAKRHISFENRVVGLLILIVVAFFVSGLFIFKAVTHTDTEAITYTEKSGAEYNVCMNQEQYNQYYDNTCLTEGMEYLTGLAERVPVTFTYDVNYSAGVETRLSYYVVSKVNIYREKNGKVLNTTEDVLVERTTYDVFGENAEVSVDVDVPFKKYNTYVTSYNNQFGLNSYATLEVVLYVDNGNVIKKASTLNMSLSDTTFSVEKTTVDNEKQNLNVPNEDWGSVNTSYAVVGLIFVLFGLFGIIKLADLVYKVTGTASMYQRRLSKILREYDREIVISRSDYTIDSSKRLIKVASFSELLDARETLEKPIVYVRVNNVKSEFYVEDSEAIYKYTMKEADFEGK